MRCTSFIVASKARGFTLLEVLLTLAILSVGLLGIGAMQIVGLKSNDVASYRSTATLVAGEMAERIRANPQQLAAGRFMNLTNADPAANCKVAPVPYCSNWLDGTTVVLGQVCDPDPVNPGDPLPNGSQQAFFDINVMYCGGLKSAGDPENRTITGLKMLPGGTMKVSCNEPDATAPLCASNPGNAEHVVVVTWNERPEGSDSSATAITRSVAVPVSPISLPLKITADTL